MGTTIGVQESTRDALERVKRELRLPSMDALLQRLLDERGRLQGRRESEERLKRVREQRRELSRWARASGIRRLAVFGSALHGDARPGSDLDILVEFVAGRVPGFGFVTLQEELSRIVGFRVDLHTPGSLSPRFRDQVLAEASEVYAAP